MPAVSDVLFQQYLEDKKIFQPVLSVQAGQYYPFMQKWLQIETIESRIGQFGRLLTFTVIGNSWPTVSDRSTAQISKAYSFVLINLIFFSFLKQT